MGKYNPQQICFLTCVSSFGSVTLTLLFLVCFFYLIFPGCFFSIRPWEDDDCRVSSSLIILPLIWPLLLLVPYFYDSTTIYLIFQNINLSIISSSVFPFQPKDPSVLSIHSLKYISDMFPLFHSHNTDLKTWSAILVPISKAFWLQAFTFLQLEC